jgi:flagellar biosynthetic protein FliP
MTRRGLLIAFVLAAAAAGIAAAPALAAAPLPRITIGASPAQGPHDVSVTLQILFLLTILSLAPAILLLMTPFTRIVIVLSFLRQALGTQSIPPNQVLVGLALFMTFFLMRPVGDDIYKTALKPYMDGKMGYEEALTKAVRPVRRFMFAQTRERDLALFVRLSKSPRPRNREDIETLVLVPAFVISELKTAFTMGFQLFIPFLVIDMVVASTLMAMGMLMLPPIMISLPFKLLLFILVDGWNLIAGSLAASFRPW